MPKFTKLEVTGVVVKAEATLTPDEAARLGLTALTSQPEDVDKLINFTDYSEDHDAQLVDQRIEERKYTD